MFLQPKLTHFFETNNQPFLKNESFNEKLKSARHPIAASIVLASQSICAERTVIQNKGIRHAVDHGPGLGETYPKVNPNVSVAISGGGSGTGIAAMINGTVDIANASRAMKDKEIEKAEHGP